MPWTWQGSSHLWSPAASRPQTPKLVEPGSPWSGPGSRRRPAARVAGAPLRFCGEMNRPR
jgi:hypothetical protein